MGQGKSLGRNVGNPVLVTGTYPVYFSAARPGPEPCAAVARVFPRLTAFPIRKLSSTKIGEFRAQTRFPGKPRIYPHIPADRPLKTVASAAQRRFNRRTSCSRTEFSDLSQKSGEISQKCEGTELGEALRKTNPSKSRKTSRCGQNHGKSVELDGTTNPHQD